jgi:hypothetical protein
MGCDTTSNNVAPPLGDAELYCIGSVHSYLNLIDVRASCFPCHH